MAGAINNITGYGKRFGNIPLPVEQSGKATEGEIMVGRTTGHMYIRNGGKNVSKTVELEEFLKAFRVGCINSIRNSGEFYEKLARSDWANNYQLETLQDGNIRFIEEDGRSFIRFTIRNKAMSESTWWTLTHLLYTYTTYKKFMRLDKQYCLSFSMRTNIENLKLKPYVAENSGSKRLWIGDTIPIQKDNWVKYESVKNTEKILPDGYVDSNLVLTWCVMDIINTNITSLEEAYIDLEYCQMEPGDRSSAWRPSWLDYYQRLDFINDGLREWVKEQINNAITECKSYTDSEIEKLTDKVEKLLQEVVKECKEYTNSEITKVNNRIDDEVDELIRRDMMQRVHLNLGNQDYTKYLKTTTGVNVDPSKVYYSNADKGLIVKGKVSLQLDLPIPITEDSKYYIFIKYIRLKGSSIAFAGIDSLDGNLNTIMTDTATTYNYGLLAGEKIYREGEVVTGKAIYSGFNATTEGTRTKFDPFAQYFKFVFMPNYDAISDEASVVVKDIEIFEIPRCLWNALDPGPRDRDGLMSVADKTKLDGIEERANRYVHPSGDGNLHVPATGTDSVNKVLTAGSTPGSLIWKLPSTDADTLDGFDSTKFLREIQVPSHRDCNQFLTPNAFFYADSGEGAILNTPEGTIELGTSRVVMVINRYSAYCQPANGIRMQQEFINVYDFNKTTRYIRNYNGAQWGNWAKVYTTSDKPTTQEINAVNKSGDTMSGNLTFNADDLGINFFDGAKIFKRRGAGLVIKSNNDVNPVVVENYSGQTIMNMGRDNVEAAGKFKSKNIDLGRFSLKANPDTGALDFIFE